MPARQIRIFLVRHGQSEANLDKSVNTRPGRDRVKKFIDFDQSPRKLPRKTLLK
jgi:broad specificity phosphatase PhoE